MTDTDELDREKELSERFTSHTKNSDDAKAARDASEAYNTDNAGDPNNPNDATRHRKQYTMYLPPDLHKALNERFARYDGIAKIKDGDGIEKHKDFNEAIIRAALDSDDLDSYIGVSASLED